ncbi:TAXI family TRAP transporter solute-binding subunit [Suttonella sp. R2A3]|uniref:TAXI family TRAP transporter solute-binding subunit n=1 Tax=Suttonella sp. R2A3 TaxID=2908648 RepID=UPI001F18903F|nr:TAXI family TRAP transporter solute-binding subunit [Suttonella sp. R2A3]UJF25255.1 TAXI family TRAP transporter solute-binding subunit [Suttonella sp. R2A3]
MKKIKRYSAFLLMSLIALTAWAQDETPTTPPQNSLENLELFSVGSGYNNGVYFLLATVLGGVISDPYGDLSCEHGGNCGVEGLLLVNVSTPGSVANIEQLSTKTLDSAFVQSNIAYWAYTASGLYENKKPFEELRALASLYPEMLHLVVRADSDIESITDLVGKRVAVGAKNTGTFLNVSDVLKAHGVDVSELQANHDDAPQAVEQFLAGDLDAIFFVAGAPMPQVQYLAEETDIRLIPTSSAMIDSLLTRNQYYTATTIPAGTYPGVDEAVPSVAVRALWLARADVVDDEMAYQLTKALWRKEHAHWLEQVLPNSALSVKQSLDGIGIPLHPGAKRYYNEIGKRF